MFLLLSQDCRLARIWLSMTCTQASRSSYEVASKCHVCPVSDTMVNSKFSSCSVGEKTERRRIRTGTSNKNTSHSATIHLGQVVFHSEREEEEASCKPKNGFNTLLVYKNTDYFIFTQTVKMTITSSPSYCCCLYVYVYISAD